MAYDPVKAHEYYIKYRKKGLKKGRKKGSKKKGSTKSLVGVSTSGLNADGKIEASLIKEKLKAEMNEKLKSAKTDAEKDEIRREYSKKANEEIQKLKSDAKYAKPKAQKATKQKASKSSSKSKSKSSGKSKSSSAPAAKTVSQIDTTLDDILNSLGSMTAEQKAELKETLTGMVDMIKGLIDSAKGGNAAEWISGMLKQRKT